MEMMEDFHSLDQSRRRVATVQLPMVQSVAQAVPDALAEMQLLQVHLRRVVAEVQALRVLV
jgi:hypothetical protein